MTRLFGKNLRVLCLLIFSGVALATAATEPVKAPQNPPASVSPELEKAAKALAEGQLDTASKWFEAAVRNTSTRSFIRGLSMFGLAQVELARQDAGAAIAAWDRLARDDTLLRFHRDAAGRRILETERLRQGLPGRDPAAYQARLPVLPEPVVVLHVARDGNDTADGSQARPFRTLERARDAVRELKKSHGEVLPKGGVRVMIGGGFYSADRTLNLAAQDSGTSEAPVIYQGTPGDVPILRGGARIAGWKPISDAKLREKLDPSVRQRVLEADLKKSHGGVLPKGGVRVMIGGGFYSADRTLNLSAQDSGTSEAPVITRARPVMRPSSGVGRGLPDGSRSRMQSFAKSSIPRSASGFWKRT